MIRQRFPTAGSFTVAGTSDDSSADCVARFTVDSRNRTTQVICQGPYLVFVIEQGNLVVSYLKSGREIRRIDHGGKITAIGNASSSMVAFTGPTTVRF